MKNGDLYFWIRENTNITNKKGWLARRISPYKDGGSLLVVDTYETAIFGIEGEPRAQIEIVNFLFSGSIYCESVDFFEKNTIYIGRPKC